MNGYSAKAVVACGGCGTALDLLFILPPTEERPWRQVAACVSCRREYVADMLGVGPPQWRENVPPEHVALRSWTEASK